MAFRRLPDRQRRDSPDGRANRPMTGRHACGAIWIYQPKRDKGIRQPFECHDRQAFQKTKDHQLGASALGRAWPCYRVGKSNSHTAWCGRVRPGSCRLRPSATHEYLLELAAAFSKARFVGGKPRDHRSLGPERNRVVVFRGGLFLAVLAGDHPVEVCGKPFSHSGNHFSWEGFRVFHRPDGHRNLNKMKGVDDADATARRDSGHRLSKVQMRVHPRHGIKEEHTQQFRSLLRIAAFISPSSRTGGGRWVWRP